MYIDTSAGEFTFAVFRIFVDYWVIYLIRRFFCEDGKIQIQSNHINVYLCISPKKKKIWGKYGNLH